MGTTDEDDIPTRRIEKLKWLPPVARVEDLPLADVAPGTLCFVEGPDQGGDEEVWEFTGGQWHKVDSL